MGLDEGVELPAFLVAYDGAVVPLLVLFEDGSSLRRVPRLHDLAEGLDPHRSPELGDLHQVVDLDLVTPAGSPLDLRLSWRSRLVGEHGDVGHASSPRAARSSWGQMTG